MNLVFVAELEDVVAAQRVMGRYTEPDRRIDLGQLIDHQHVVDISEPGATVFLGEQDSQKSQLGRLGEQLARELLRLVELFDDGIDLFAREVAGRLPYGFLLRCQ